LERPTSVVRREKPMAKRTVWRKNRYARGPPVGRSRQSKRVRVVGEEAGFSPVYGDFVVALYQGQPSENLTDELLVAPPFDRVVRKKTGSILTVGKDVKVAMDYNVRGQ